MNKVEQLLQQKRAQVARRKRKVIVPEDDRTLRWGRNRFRLLAEIKRRSLSAGAIRTDLEPAAVAKSYEMAGVAAISVLTEENFFGGALEDLRNVRAAVSLPLLQKDFVIDEFQILEAKEAGADFVLLIARFLTAQECHGFLRLCREIKINAILEITNEKDLAKIDEPVDFLGVNSRDLETLQVDISNFARLRNLLPDAFLIAESGISDVRILQEIVALGYHGALIGEHFLRVQDPGEEAARFVDAVSRRPKIKICGITSVEDARLAIGSGADALGFIFAESPRKVDPEAMARIRPQIPDGVLSVGVFRGQSRQDVVHNVHQYALDVAQIYDPLDLEVPTWLAQVVTDDGARASRPHILWDVKAPEADLAHIWQSLARGEVFALAGGLTPDNVAHAIRLCQPEWIDVARGVEHSPGIKDQHKLSAFMKACGVVS